MLSQETEGQQRKPNLFCFFSGYTERHYKVKLIERRIDSETLNIRIQSLRNNYFRVYDHIQVNGVLCLVVESASSEFMISTTFSLAESTSLNTLKENELVTIGILAENDEKHEMLYTLHPSATGTAIFMGSALLEGHQHTLKMDFSCIGSYACSINEGEYIGLSGSSLTPREVRYEGDKVYFSIYCGQETQEKTQFNKDLTPGAKVEFILPHQVIMSSLSIK